MLQALRFDHDLYCLYVSGVTERMLKVRCTASLCACLVCPVTTRYAVLASLLPPPNDVTEVHNAMQVLCDEMRMAGYNNIQFAIAVILQGTQPAQPRFTVLPNHVSPFCPAWLCLALKEVECIAALLHLMTHAHLEEHRTSCHSTTQGVNGTLRLPRSVVPQLSAGCRCGVPGDRAAPRRRADRDVARRRERLRASALRCHKAV
jgi:hypothetical protein